MSGLAAGGQEMNLREIDALAAAHAETGNFIEALALVDRAIQTVQKNPAPSSAGWLKTFELRRTYYAASRPFHIVVPAP